MCFLQSQCHGLRQLPGFGMVVLIVKSWCGEGHQLVTTIILSQWIWFELWNGSVRQMKGVLNVITCANDWASFNFQKEFYLLKWEYLGGILYLTNLFLHTKLFFVLVYFPHVSSKVLKDNMAKITMWRIGVIISGVSEPRRWMKGEGCALGNSAQIVTYRTVNVQGVGNACYTHYASGTQVTRHVLLSGM